MSRLDDIPTVDLPVEEKTPPLEPGIRVPRRVPYRLLLALVGGIPAAAGGCLAWANGRYVLRAEYEQQRTVSRGEVDKFIYTLASYQMTMNDLVTSNRDLAREVVALKVQVAAMEAHLADTRKPQGGR